VSRAQAARLVEGSIVLLRQAVDHFLFGAGAVARSDSDVFQLIPAVVAQEKRFNTVVQAGLNSLIFAERRAKRPSQLRRLGRNIVRPLRQAVALMTQLYRSAVDDVRYLRVPYRQGF
jgi:hypothetical protein